jgi:hypothetical protein
VGYDLIHIKNPHTITLPDGSDVAIECIRRNDDGTAAVRIDLWAPEGEWIELTEHYELRIPDSEIDTVERFGPRPKRPPIRYGTHPRNTGKRPAV